MLDRLIAIPILFCLWLVNTVFRLISIKTTWRLGEALGSLCYYLMPTRRAIVRHNLQVVSKHLPEMETDPQMTKRIFRRSVANLISSLKTYSLKPGKISECVKVQVAPCLMERTERGEGAILCLAHMGNWEILSKIAPFTFPAHTSFGALYRPLDNKAADQYVAQQRARYGCQMYPKGTPMGRLSGAIREGRLLGILADQRAGGSRNSRPFFGALTSRSKLPAVLHLRTGAPLYSVAVYATAAGRWQIDITPIALPTGEKLTTDEVVGHVTTAYEETFTKHFLDVFWLHRYWRDRSQKRN